MVDFAWCGLRGGCGGNGLAFCHGLSFTDGGFDGDDEGCGGFFTVGTQGDFGDEFSEDVAAAEDGVDDVGVDGNFICAAEVEECFEFVGEAVDGDEVEEA